MSVHIINTTPDAITIISNEGVETDPKTKQFMVQSSQVVVIETFSISDVLAHVSMNNEIAGDINGIPLQTIHFGDIQGLPPQENDKVYIVSLPVLTAAKALGRTDCLSVGGIVQDKNNASIIVGWLFFQK